MKVVVFLGPSLSLKEARQILPDAIYLPPAGQMDLFSVARNQKPDVIALIDGVFESKPAVWHKEILGALEDGVSVFGASSMGALRVAETAAFGAVGVGRIYRMFAQEGLLDDDEVALSHAGSDFGHRPLTEAMVNVRATLQNALEQGALNQAEHDHLVEQAKKQHFTQRTLATIAATGEQPEFLLQTLRQHYVDLKGQDARELLTHLRDLSDQDLPKAQVHTERSSYFLRFSRQDRQIARPHGKIPFDRVAHFFALHSADFEHVSFHGLNMALVQILAEMLEVETEPAEVAAEIKRFRLYHSIAEAALPQWIEENDLTPGDFEILMTQRARCRRLHRWLVRGSYRSGLCTSAVINELRCQNRYAEWLEETIQQDNLVIQSFPDFPQPDYWAEDVPQLLLEHLRATSCRMPVNNEEWAGDAGFRERDAMILELTRARLARRALRELASF